MRDDRARETRKHRIDDDEADAQIGAGKCRARVESEPAEGKYKGTERQPSARYGPASPSVGPVNRICRCAGPITMAPARPIMPPIAWTTPEPAKSTAP